MSKLRRTLVVGATLVAMNLAGLAAVAQPDGGDSTTQRELSESWNAYNQSTRVPPAELKARLQADATQRRLSDRWTYYNQATRMSPAELEAWTQAKDRTGTPTAPPAPVTTPARPAEPGGQPAWLVVSLGILAAALALAGLAMLAARRAHRTTRVRQAI